LGIIFSLAAGWGAAEGLIEEEKKKRRKEEKKSGLMP